MSVTNLSYYLFLDHIFGLGSVLIVFVKQICETNTSDDAY